MRCHGPKSRKRPQNTPQNGHAPRNTWARCAPPAPLGTARGGQRAPHDMCWAGGGRGGHGGAHLGGGGRLAAPPTLRPAWRRRPLGLPLQARRLSARARRALYGCYPAKSLSRVAASTLLSRVPPVRAARAAANVIRGGAPLSLGRHIWQGGTGKRGWVKPAEGGGARAGAPDDGTSGSTGGVLPGTQVLRRATALRRAHHALAMSWATCCGRRVGRMAALEFSGPPR